MITIAPEKVRRVGDCLIWTGPFYDDGQPMAQINGGPTRLHRRLYEEAHGPLPIDVCVLRLCNRAACIELAHMWAGTRADKWAWDRLSDPRLVPRRVIRHVA
jgi:hypothetical protein